MGQLMIVVGAPVTQRAWILRRWFDHFRIQEGVSTRSLYFLFVYGEPRAVLPDDTLTILRGEQQNGDWARVEILHDDGNDHYPRRVWDVERYKTMARLRNRLLTRVRSMEPDFYLSCDTDILLPANALRRLVEEVEHFDGVSPLTYMTPDGTRFPNVMNEGWTTRPDVDKLHGTVEVDAAFAVKLMTPKLYARVDYIEHPMGEDLGWANSVRAEGLKLGLVTDVRAKHVMSEERLNVMDVRVGF